MRLFWTAYSVLLASMSLVVLSSNVQTFLVFWEIMSLSSFLLVATDHEPRKTRQAALIYLSATRLATGLLAGGFLWAHAITGTWTFAEWHLAGLRALGPGLLVLAGLGVKAGMWPFHLWLPIAHPAAPAPVSAMMSGVMVKIAIAVTIRLFVLAPAFQNPAFGYILLILGSMGAAWGILFALVQQDLKRMLALSTVENVGLILLSVGACLIAGRLGLTWVAKLALAGALFHMVNHAIFKSLLFLSAGAIDTSAKSRDLGLLGGLGKRMPTTYACFLVGAAAVSALPPFSGFASEWLLYQSALSASFSADEPLIRFGSLVAITSLALIGALVAACFIRTVGVTFQGRPRSANAEAAHEATPGMCFSQIVLAGCSASLGLAGPFMLKLLQIIVGPLSAGNPSIATAWTVPLLPASLVMLITFAALGACLLDARSTDPPREFVTWDCGFGVLGPRVQMTSISFAQPLVRMFGTLFNYAQSMRLEGLDSRLFPLSITTKATIDHPLEDYVYGPIARWFQHLADEIISLQHGSVHRYLLTMLVTLTLLLLIGVYLR
jgi:hydrogenase-4 component B